MVAVKRLVTRMRASRLQDLLLAVLAVTTTLLLGASINIVVHLLRYVRALRAGDAAAAMAALGPYPLYWSLVSMVLFVIAGWVFWTLVKRRQIDQLRLRRSEQKYRNIINHAGEAIFLLDEAGRVLEWNKMAELLFDVPRRNVLGRPFRDIHICYGIEIDKAMADAARLNRSLSFEFPLRRLDAQSGLLSMTVSPISGDSRRVDDPRAGGDAPTFVLIARDITSEKQLETKMSETEKLASIGQLAAGIAHQLNTPLGSILLSAQMLEETNRSDEDAEDLSRIIRQTEQCRNIIKGLLNFARPSGRERNPQRLADLARDTIFLMEKNIKLAGVEVAIDEREEIVILGNRNELDQVFFNLLANSLDAMPAGGRIDIVLESGAEGEARVIFEDSGEGIPEEQREKVFLPFFTTKEYGKGTGLGLSILARIIHEHGGTIELERGEAGGARFVMTFPRSGAASRPRSESRP